MAASKVHVAFVGGGRTGTPLLEDLLSRPWAEVMGLADVNAASPGAILAREHGVFVTDDAMIFASKGDEIDVLIEVSGDPAVKRRLKEAFQHFSSETSKELARKDDEPQVNNIDPTRLPPASLPGARTMRAARC